MYENIISNIQNFLLTMTSIKNSMEFPEFVSLVLQESKLAMKWFSEAVPIFQIAL